MSEEIVIRAPSADKPGYLRRVREAVRIQERMRVDNSVEAFDEMVDFILDTSEVQVPDGVDAKDALLDLSKEDFDAIFDTLTGSSSGTVDPRSGA